MTAQLARASHVDALGRQTSLPVENAALLGAMEEVLSSPGAALVDAEGNSTPIPDEIHDILLSVVEAMQAGRAITLQPVTMKLTTGEAAQMLGVSRPTLVKLLEEGKIPFTKPNRHRYVLLTDMLAYIEQQRKRQHELLNALTRDAVENGLYNIDSKTALEALQRVRKG